MRDRKGATGRGIGDRVLIEAIGRQEELDLSDAIGRMGVFPTEGGKQIFNNSFG